MSEPIMYTANAAYVCPPCRDTCTATIDREGNPIQPVYSWETSDITDGASCDICEGVIIKPHSKTYEFQGTFTYMVDATSEEEAAQKLDDALGNVVWEYKVDNTYS